MKSKIYSGVTILALLCVQNIFAGSSKILWSDINLQQAKSKGEQAFAVNKARYLSLDLSEMRTILANAPMEQTMEAKTQPVTLQIPMPDGGFSRFEMVESPVMHPALAAKYPMIKTYSGQGIDDVTATIRVDVTQFGFHAMILSVNGDVLINPVNLNTDDTYICFYKRDAINKNHSTACEFDPVDELNQHNSKQIVNDVQKRKNEPGVSANRSAGAILRTYRLALACTGEYAATYGGTVSGAVAGMVTSVNRVTGVYEHELAIRLTLIANNDTLVFTSAATDPYTNNNGPTMLGQNQTTITQRIGSANYDIGHVFSTGGGGIAGLGVVCQSSQKARGVTGLPSPVGDAFDIDYVAHEIGHQFGGNHTFNSVSGGCGGGNRAGSAAYEPGSGITIMAYAGLCAPDNLANNSIAYFHTKSFDEIQDYTTFSSGFSCPVSTPTGNIPPVSNLSVYHYDVPLATPFKLTGAGSDPNGDTITYSFEEFDLGPGGAWNSPSGNAPVFMPNIPTLNNWRLFPKLINIRNNVNTPGDFKANYARTLNFRMILRDNRNNGGGVTYDDQTIEVNVVNTTTPFAITYPNTTGISWPAGSTQTLTWDVANTTAAPISTNNVNIYLSVTGGTIYPFPILIASNVPNTGSYTFTVPNNVTTTARILVEAVGNIFLDMNDKNFEITPFVSIAENIAGESVNIYPNPAEDVLNVSLSGKLRGNVSITMTDAVGRVVNTKQVSKMQSGLVEYFNIANYSLGVYFVRIDTDEGSLLRKIVKL